MVMEKKQDISFISFISFIVLFPFLFLDWVAPAEITGSGVSDITYGAHV